MFELNAKVIIDEKKKIKMKGYIDFYKNKFVIYMIETKQSINKEKGGNLILKG